MQTAANVVDIPGRGKGLKAARNVRSGEVILAESPILLIPSDNKGFCSACLRTLPGSEGEYSELTA